MDIRASATHNVYVPSTMQSFIPGAPVIQSFTATPSTIDAGQSSVLSWSVSGATKITITGIGTVTGISINVQPVTTTVYTLQASNASGTAMAQTTVNVNAGNPGFQYSTFLLPYTQNSIITVSKTPQVAVDAKGGVHVIYTSNYPDSSGVRPAYYAYCPSNCDSKANFTTVAMGDNMINSQIALDPNGHPRVLLTSWPLVGGAFDSPWHYDYGECNTSCTDLANWTFSTIVVALGHTLVYGPDNIQSFALDAQGHPRFLYNSQYSSVVPDAPTGTFYAYCNATCTDSANWQSTKLSDATWDSLELAFTPAGQPRMGFIYFTNNANYQWALGYGECDDTVCNNGGTNGLAINGSPQGSGPANFSFRLDTHGRPRIAYYTGWASDGTCPGTRLYYLTCDANCTQTNTWQAIDIGMPSKTSDGTAIYEGENGVGLAIDQQDNPRIAFRMGFSVDELAYAWCNANCVADASGWSYDVVWSTAAQTNELGLPPRGGCPDCIPPIPPCPLGFWDAGYWPSVALDAASNPRIAYEIDLQNGGGGCEANTWARMSRFAIFNQP
jgi:hypothetical protein